MTKIDLINDTELFDEVYGPEPEAWWDFSPIETLDLSTFGSETWAWSLCRQVADQYVKAMSRGSDWWNPNIAEHIFGWFGELVHDGKGNYLIGSFITGPVFAISHFAPRTLRGGMEMLAELAEDYRHPVVCAVPQPKADMLARLGWTQGPEIWQWFAGEEILKRTCLNLSAVRFAERHPDLYESMVP